MALNSEHPFYSEYKEDWMMMRDLYRGERAVKRRGQLYLPATTGMHIDGLGYDNIHKPKPGQRAYDSYLKRAFFQDLVKEGVEALIGMMHQKPATFELPDAMQPLVEKCTLTGEGLQEVLRNINTEQLTEGRVGILADLPAAPLVPAPQGSSAPPILPYIALYNAEDMVNWDAGDTEEGQRTLNLVVLNESGFMRSDDFTWRELLKYRVLQLGPIMTDEVEGQYSMGVFSNHEGANNLVYDEKAMKSPMLRGATMDEIPFVFINTKDICADPDEPPLLGLGRLALAIYRGDADYRQSLFMTGQDTLVVTGAVVNKDGTQNDDALRIGAGARIDVEIGGDAKFIGVTANGLSEQRQSLQNDRALAAQKAGNLIQPGPSKQDESGEALKTRITAQTATLNQIANTGAKGLENLLKMVATWMGLPAATIATIKVTPNLEFADFALVAADIVQLMTAKSLGAPLSKESVHGIMVERGITQMTFEDETAAIEDEAPDLPKTTPGALLPPGPNNLNATNQPKGPITPDNANNNPDDTNNVSGN